MDGECMTEELSIKFKLNKQAPIVYETQIEGMRQLVSPERFKPIEEFVRAHCRIVDDSEKFDDVYETWARIREQIYASELKRLGSLPIEQGTNLDTLKSDGVYRVASNPDVSGVRGLGHRPSSVYIDEPHYFAAFHCWWGDGVTASKWMEHRVFCKRAVLACLSGE
jgi:hypothetical protein